MNKLFVVTSVSELMTSTIIREHLKDASNVTIVTTNVAFYANYSKRFENMFLIDGVPVSDSRDTDFANLALPGDLLGETFPNTSLEIWKVLSLDRLKHWYNPEFRFIQDFIEKISWDVLYVSSDLGQTIPLMAGFSGEGGTRVWVKTEPLRTREFMDLLGSGVFPFRAIMTDSGDDAKFIQRHGRGIQAIVAARPEAAMPIDQRAKDHIKANMGINGNVLCVFFDRRDEWQCRNFIVDGSYRGQFKYTFVYPVDERSRELVHTSIPNAHKFLLAQDTLLKIADNIVSFRWDDNYMRGIEIPMYIIDYNGMNKALFLAPEGVKVQ